MLAVWAITTQDGWSWGTSAAALAGKSEGVVHVAEW